jgi:hypothetical protein
MWGSGGFRRNNSPPRIKPQLRKVSDHGGKSSLNKQR